MKIAILLLILSIVYNRYCSFYLCLGYLGHHLDIWNIGHLLQVSGYWIQYWDTIMFCNTDSGYHQYYMSRFGQKYLKSTRVILATPGTSVMHEMSFLSNTWWPLNHFISEKSPSPQWEMGMSMMLIHQLCCVLPGVQKIVKRPLVYLVKTCRSSINQIGKNKIQDLWKFILRDALLKKKR